MNRILELLRAKKNILVYAYVNLVYLYYILQLSTIDETYIKLTLLFSYLIFPLILVAKKIQFKNIILIGLICLSGYALTRLDSRYLSIITIFFVLWEENISHLFKSLMTTSTISLLISIIIGVDHINGLCIGLGLLTYLLFLSTNFKNNNIYIYILIGINILLFGFIKAGQAIICINFCFILILLLKYSKKSYIPNKKIWSTSFLVCAALNIYLALSTHNHGLMYLNNILPSSFNTFVENLLNKIDTLMSYRLSLSNISLNLFGFKLYGNVLNPNHPQLKDAYFNVDSGYLQILQSQGFIIFIVIMILLTIIMVYFCQIRRWDLIIIGITISLWGINEDILVSPIGNILWLYLPQALDYFRKNCILERSKKKCIKKYLK